MSQQQQVPVTTATGRRRFARLPEDVLARSDLGVYSKLVLLVLNMESYGAGIVALSDSMVALKCGISRTQALASRGELERLGLIVRDGAPVKQVQPYRLLHPQMAAGAGGEARPVVAVTTRRTLLKCSSCGARCKALLKTGWCRQCHWKLKVRRVVEEIEAGKTA